MLVSLSTEEALETYQNKTIMDYSQPTKDQLVLEPGKMALSITGISNKTILTRRDTPNTSILSLEYHGYTVKPHNALSVTMTRLPLVSNLNTFNKKNWVGLCSGSSPVINTVLSLTPYLKP